jgi:L-malate glycosyltransferase
MKKLKIVYIGSFNAHYVWPYIDYFCKMGHDVSLISYDQCEVDGSANCAIYDVSFGANARRKWTKWKYLFSAIKVRFLLKKIKPDIVHGHYATSAGVICLLSGFHPFIISVRGSDLIGSLRSWIWRQLLFLVFRKSEYVHTVSEQLTREAQVLGVNKKNCFTLSQGVDTEFFSFTAHTEIASRPLVLICTRRLEEIYDSETIIRACKIVLDFGIPMKLIFAANGGLETELKSLTRSLEIESFVSFLGGFKNKDLPLILSEASIYVSASLWDGTSVSLLEGMSSGLFPIVSRIDSNKSWLIEGETALMFEPGNHIELAESIIRIYGDECLMISAIEKNRECILDKANRTKNMKILEGVYYKISKLEDSLFLS